MIAMFGVVFERHGGASGLSTRSQPAPIGPSPATAADLRTRRSLRKGRSRPTRLNLAADSLEVVDQLIPASLHRMFKIGEAEHTSLGCRPAESCLDVPIFPLQGRRAY